MIVFVNPHAGSGTGLMKWRRIEPVMRERFADLRVILLDSPDALTRGLHASRRSGDARVVAAGGDGTANAVIHALLSERQRYGSTCILGAIGLGSSNDFHKPRCDSGSMDGIRTRLDFPNATWCDAGRIIFSCDGHMCTRHFFLNASAGITAEGNRRFNQPGPVLAVLKRTSIRAAILYAALTAVAGYKNTPVTLTLPGSDPLTTPLTNIGILKSPFFSGDLHYDIARNYQNGRFAVVSCERMSLLQRVQLFRSLQRGTTDGLPGIRSWSTASITVESARPIPIEFDGETVLTASARFDVVPHALKVCP
jgi:diacylglycerol kinase family enzyme